MNPSRILRSALLAAVAVLSCCASPPPLATAELVDLELFMGDWFVIAHIPAPGEEQAFNGVESYELRDDGSIATTYTFRDGGFAGPIEVLRPTGYVRNRATNATWGMEFFWPYHAEYLISYVDPFYAVTIIGRSARDFAWIMARSPVVTPARYDELLLELERQGYDPARLRRVPQRWPDPEHPLSARIQASATATAVRDDG